MNELQEKQFNYYKNKSIALMNEYEELTQVLMSDKQETSELETKIWESIDNKDLRRLGYAYNSLVKLVDSVSMD